MQGAVGAHLDGYYVDPPVDIAVAFLLKICAGNIGKARLFDSSHRFLWFAIVAALARTDFYESESRSVLSDDIHFARWAAVIALEDHVTA